MDDQTLGLPQTAKPRISASTAIEDLRLVRGALARRAAEVEVLVVRLRVLPRLLAALNARFGWPLDGDELADVAQDSVGLVWRKLERFDGTSSLETWFYGIARFELLNSVRRRRRRDLGRRELRDESGEAPGLTDWLEIDSLRSALEKLPQDEARILWLHYFDGLALSEVAGSTGAALGTVKSQYYRALGRLRQWLRAGSRENGG